MLPRPSQGDYAPYYTRYIEQLPDSDILAFLEKQGEEIVMLYHGFGEQHGGLRYASGKWSVKDILGHLIDGERIFAYRALHIARGDATPLPGFEEDDYARESNASERTIEDLTSEFRAVRVATLALFRSFSSEMWERFGVANNAPIKVSALPFIIAGHTAHHTGIIRERYMPLIDNK